jgi:hypothetical protein
LSSPNQVQHEIPGLFASHSGRWPPEDVSTPAFCPNLMMKCNAGEIIPQAICSRHGVAVGASVAPVVRMLMWVCAPVSWPLGWVLHKALGREDPLFPRQHLQTILSLHGQDAGAFDCAVGTQLLGTTGLERSSQVTRCCSADGGSI